MRRTAPGAAGDVVLVSATHLGVAQAVARALCSQGLRTRTVTDTDAVAVPANVSAVVLVAEDPARIQPMLDRWEGRNVPRLVLVTEPGTAQFHGRGVDVVSPDARLEDLMLVLTGARNGAPAPRTYAHTSARSPSARPPVVDELTEREREVLSHLVGPVGHDDIAAELGISPNTVRTHVRNIYGKLGAHDRVEAVSIAWRSGLIIQRDHGELSEVGEVA